MNINVYVNDKGVAVVLGEYLRHLLLVHDHYSALGCRVLAFSGLQLATKGQYEVAVASGQHYYDVKITVRLNAVQEYAREER